MLIFLWNELSMFITPNFTRPEFTSVAFDLLFPLSWGFLFCLMIWKVLEYRTSRQLCTSGGKSRRTVATSFYLPSFPRPRLCATSATRKQGVDTFVFLTSGSGPVCVASRRRCAAARGFLMGQGWGSKQVAKEVWFRFFLLFFFFYSFVFGWKEVMFLVVRTSGPLPGGLHYWKRNLPSAFRHGCCCWWSRWIFFRLLFSQKSTGCPYIIPPS